MIYPPGASFTFQSPQELMYEQWMSARLEPSVRFAIVVASMIYHEMGVPQLRILRLLGNTPEELAEAGNPHAFGLAADISIMELLNRRAVAAETKMSLPAPRVKAFLDRMNLLLPSDNHRPFVRQEESHVHIQVPGGGFRKENQSLACWWDAGPTGKRRPIKRARR